MLSGCFAANLHIELRRLVHFWSERNAVGAWSSEDPGGYTVLVLRYTSGNKGDRGKTDL